MATVLATVYEENVEVKDGEWRLAVSRFGQDGKLAQKDTTRDLSLSEATTRQSNIRNRYLKEGWVNGIGGRSLVNHITGEILTVLVERQSYGQGG